METKSLSVEEANARLVSYKSPEITSELYEFGKMMVGECVERNHRADSKATMLTGYAGTILALLVATSSVWKPTMEEWATGVVFSAAFAALCSAACALAARGGNGVFHAGFTVWVGGSRNQNLLAEGAS